MLNLGWKAFYLSLNWEAIAVNVKFFIDSKLWWCDFWNLLKSPGFYLFWVDCLTVLGELF